MNAFRFTTLTCAVLSSLGHGSIALAQQEALPSVEVSGASILPSNIQNLPGSSNVVDAKQLEQREPFSIIELVREVPGLYVVSEDAAGTHLNIGLRGLNPRRSSRTLLLEDGAPTVFFAPYGDPSAHYSTPLERIDRLEVLKGSGQILYGPQTLGGMVNFVTKPVPTNGLEGSAKLSVGNQGYRGAHVNVGTGSQQGGIMIDLLSREGDGIREQHNFNVQDVTIKGQLNINAQHSLVAKYTRFEEKSLFSETGLTAAEYRNNPYSLPGSAGERYDMERDTVQLIHRWDLANAARLSTQLYHTRSDRQSRRSREFEPDNAAQGHGELETTDFAIRPRQYKVFGIEPKLEFTHNAFGMPSETIIGMRYHTEDIDRKKFKLDSLYGNVNEADERLLADIEATALYAQNTFLAGDWTFTPGLRLEHIEQSKTLFVADAGNPLQFARADSLQSSKTETLPGLGFTWNGLANSTVFGGIHKGFAPPRPDRDIADNAMGMPRLQNVTPELATVTELGIRSASQAGQWEATLFNMNINDLVVQSGSIFRNEGKAQHTGFELAGRYNLGALLTQQANPYFVSMAYTNLFTAKFKNSGKVGGEGEDGYGDYTAGNRLPYAPKHTLSLNLSYETEAWNARLGATHLSRQFANTENLRGTGPEGFCPNGDDPANNLFCGVYGEIESVTLLNASIRYTPAGSKVAYFLNAENLTNKQYIATRTNGIHPGRQRQVVGGIQVKF